jgi:hypothetical protein
VCHAFQVPARTIELVGHRARTLVIQIASPSEPLEPNIRFDSFTCLATLVITGAKLSPGLSLPVQSPFHSLLRDIRTCPSLPNVSTLVIRNSLDWYLALDLIKACKYLRRLAFDAFEAGLGAGGVRTGYARVPPESLEELSIRVGQEKEALAPLYAATHLVSLSIQGPLDANNRLVRQVIEASSRSLQAISLVNCEGSSLLDDRALANAMASCTSLRFLRLSYYLTLDFMALHDLFMLLAHLPIEFLSFRGIPRVDRDSFTSDLMDNFHLFPRLSVIEARLNMGGTLRLKSKFIQLVIEALGGVNYSVWPPIYHQLSPEAQAVFEHRTYRTSSPLPFLGA